MNQSPLDNGEAAGGDDWPNAPSENPARSATTTEVLSRGGGTGIPAAVLALLGGLFHLIGVAGGAVLMAGDADLGWALLTFLLHLVVAALLIIGGVGLVLAKPFGRAVTIVGSVTAILLYFVVLVIGAFDVYFLGLTDRALPTGYAAVLCVPALTTLVLASVRPTGRWVAGGWS